MARTLKTDYHSKTFKHREHRSKKGRRKDYKETKKMRIRMRDQEEYVLRKRAKYKNFNSEI